jgi:hypothetical protein
MARCYYLTSHTVEADEIVNNLLQRSIEWLTWIETINRHRIGGSLHSRYEWMQTMLLTYSLADQFDRKEIINKYKCQYENLIKKETD